MSTQATADPPSAPQPQDASRQFLTFQLATEEYGVDILRVQEIKGMDTITPMPDVPVHIRGVVNLRGIIVPVMDLRRGLGLAPKQADATTVMIVLKVYDETCERTLGLIVDAVSEVYHFNAGEIKPAPDFGAALNTEYVQGIATVDDRMLILLDVDTLVHKGLLADLPTRH